MLLPTRGVSTDRALLTVAARVAHHCSTPMSVTAVWDWYDSASRGQPSEVSFDWFALALDLAYAIGVLDMTENGDLVRRDHVPATA